MMIIIIDRDFDTVHDFLTTAAAVCGGGGGDCTADFGGGRPISSMLEARVRRRVITQMIKLAAATGSRCIRR